jgi:hypothetical protein
MTLLTGATWAFGSPPRILVEAVSVSPPIVGLMNVYRVHPDGTRYLVITNGVAVLNGEWSGYDYHPPFNTPLTYQAEAGGVVSPLSPTVTVNSDQAWLIHPSVPELSMQVEIMAPQKEIKHATVAQRFDVLNRKLPVIVNDGPRGGEQGEFVVRVTRQNRTQIKALLADGGPILLNGPWGEHDLGWKWIQPDDISIENVAGNVQFATRNVTIPFIECAQPDADLVAPWSYADLRSANASYTTVKSGFANYLNTRLKILGG